MTTKSFLMRSRNDEQQQSIKRLKQCIKRSASQLQLLSHDLAVLLTINSWLSFSCNNTIVALFNCSFIFLCHSGVTHSVTLSLTVPSIRAFLPPGLILFVSMGWKECERIEEAGQEWKLILLHPHLPVLPLVQTCFPLHSGHLNQYRVRGDCVAAGIQSTKGDSFLFPVSQQFIQQSIGRSPEKDNKWRPYPICYRLWEMLLLAI